MTPSTSRRRKPVAVAGVGLVLAVGLALTACGQVRAPGAAGGGAPSASAGAPSASESPAGASPYVEPGAGDGAPHYNENNAYRQTREMSPEHAKDAEREAERIKPVIERLWEQRKWDPAAVRTALLRLGYEEERFTEDGERLGGKLTVRAMDKRYRDGGYVTPEGALVGLRVHPDACVMAFVQKSNFEVRADGPYLETGCFPPPFSH
ncbi:hypothetical protein [Streptomyces sp. cf386]|uniref:hypothetical protein n=1 Tax=Streptomyces sp. cf386 TaxID=1761904 RepID=UPI000B84A38A|nr:hypothetical protein [Streptomyces sp. cf386]